MIKKILLSIIIIGTVAVTLVLGVLTWGNALLTSYASKYVKEHFNVALTIKTLDLIPWRGRITAEDISLHDNDKGKISATRLVADLSIHDLLDGKITLSECNVENAVAMFPSELFSHFSSGGPAPEIPANKTGFTLPLKIESGKISNLNLTETVAEGKQIEIKNGNVLVTGDYSGMHLRETIDKILLHDGEKQSDFGSLDTTQYVADNLVRIDSLELTGGEASIRSSALSILPRLSGTIKTSFNTTSFLPPEKASLPVTAQFTVSGDLHSIDASYSADAHGALVIGGASFKDLTIAGNLYKSAENFRLAISHLDLDGSSGFARIEEPLTISDANLAGKVSLDLAGIAFDSFGFEKLTGQATLAGTLNKPLVTANATSEGLRAGPVAFGPISVSLANDGLETVTADINESANELGSLALHSVVRLADAPQLETATLSISRNLQGPKLTFNGESSAHGPLTLKGLVANATIKGQLETPAVLPFDLRADLQDGKLAVNLYQGSAVKVRGDIAFGEGQLSKVTATLRQPNISAWYPGIECGTLAASADYQFSFADPANGNGNLNIHDTTVGCEANTLNISGPPITIAAGGAQVSGLNIRTGLGLATLSGEASPKALNLNAKGNLDLAALAPLVPTLESLSGLGKISINVTGDPKAPDINGRVEVSNVNLEMPVPPIDVVNGVALVEMHGKEITLQKLSGAVNDGTLEGSGSVSLADPSNTIAAKVSFKNVYLQPVSDAEVTMSGDLTLVNAAVPVVGQALGIHPKIDGTITIDDAKYEKEFSLGLVRQKLASFFESANVKLSADEKPTLPIDFDIAINGESSVLLNTNLIQAELSPHLHLQGDTGDMKLQGAILVPAGGFSLRNNHFEITNGRLGFNGEGFEPSINVSAETRAQDVEGFPLTIFMEITGPASDTRVALSSDTGLPQQAILKLLTSGQGGAGQGLADSAVQQAGLNHISLLGRNTYLGPLSRIDELSVEPSYNASTGEFGSKLVSSERLTDSIKAGAQFPIAGRTEQPQASLTYDILSYLGAVGSLKLPQDQLEQSYAGDLNWKLISGEPPLPVTFSGGKEIGLVNLASVLGITPRSTLNPARRPALEKRLTTYYRDHGFLDASVTSECENNCEQLHFTINEGPRYILQRFALDRELEPYFKDTTSFVQKLGIDLATRETQLQAQQALFENLRKAGYPRARIKTFYETSGEGMAILHLTGKLKQHYALRFTRNNNFSEESLLDAFRYYERSIAFGPSFPYDMRLDLEQFYREHGYARVGIAMQIDQTKKTDGSQDDQIAVWYDIFEGPKVSVANVMLEGSPIGQDTVRSLLALNESKTIFSPGLYNPEAARAGAKLLENMYRKNGYPQATVIFKEKKLAYTSVALQYVVEPGEAQKFFITTQGAPADVIFEAPSKALSDSEAKELLKTVERETRQAGYFDAKLSLKENEKTGTALITVIPGEQRKFGEIAIEGYEQIDREVIAKAIPFKQGDPFSWKLVGDTRRSLYRLGLFLKVDLYIEDSKLGTNYRSAKIIVHERPLSALSVTTGYDSTYGAHLGLNGTDHSLFKDGRELTVRSDLYYDLDQGGVNRGFGSLRFRDPQITENSSWTEELGYVKTQDSSYQEFSSESLFLRSELQYIVNPELNLKVNHSLEDIRVSDVPEDIILSDLDEGKILLSTVGGGIFYTDQDDPINPRAAKKAAFEFKLSSSAIGSDADYASLLPKISLLEPLAFIDDRLSVLASLQAGVSKAFSDTEEIPITKRFYLGGQDSVRGYRENSLGPRGTLDHIIGGDRYYAGTGELHYEVVQNVIALTFVDAGQLWLKDGNTDDLRLATGIGARYSSPIGAIGLDIGVPLNPDKHADAYEIYFRIGTTF